MTSLLGLCAVLSTCLCLAMKWEGLTPAQQNTRLALIVLGCLVGFARVL